MKNIRTPYWFVFLVFFAGGCATAPSSEVKAPKMHLKEICAMYDISWSWDSISEMVTLQKDNRKASILLGSHVAIMGSKKVYLSQPLKRERSMIVVPMDFKDKIIDPMVQKLTVRPNQPSVKVAKTRKRPYWIVIDPGHGGKDPGATGKSGLQEKVVVLDISLRLKKILAAQGFNVKLTRSMDHFISLGQRTEIASKNNADLFVSVHANSSPARSARGVEVYTLRTLEPQERKEEQRVKNHHIMFQQLAMKKGDMILEDLIADLLFQYKQAESRVVAQYLAHGVTQVANTKNRGLRKSGFFVLRNTLIPAVLVEVGFLSNANEEKLLMTAAYRQKVANGLAVSIMKYAGK